MRSFIKTSLLLLSFFIFSCSKNNTDYPNLIVLGHGGMGEKSLKYPISSKESVQACLQTEANGSEVDVQITKDSLLVCYHDENLSSKTKCDLGYVNNYNWNEIESCVYSTFSGSKKQIALLSDVLQINSKQKKTISLDCKLYDAQQSTDYIFIFERAVSRFIIDYSTKYDFIVEARDTLFLKNIKQKHPATKCFFLAPNTSFLSDATLKNNLIDGYSLDVESITKDEAIEAKNKGLLLMYWACNSRNQNKLALELKADIIQTDELNHLIREQKN